MIRDEQLKFQFEIRSTVTGLQLHQAQMHIGYKQKGSANHIGSSSNPHTVGRAMKYFEIRMVKGYTTSRQMRIWGLWES